MPFVQGQLWQKDFRVTIKTTCAHSKRPMEIIFDNHLNFEVSDGVKPMLFEPSVDWLSFSEPNIINAY